MSLNNYLPLPYKLADTEVGFGPSDLHPGIEFYDTLGNKITGIFYLDDSLDIAENVKHGIFKKGLDGKTIGQGYFMKFGKKRYIITKIIADAKKNNGYPNPVENRILAREIKIIYTLPNRYTIKSNKKGGKHRTQKCHTKKRRTQKHRTQKRRTQKRRTQKRRARK